MYTKTCAEKVISILFRSLPRYGETYVDTTKTQLIAKLKYT